MPNVKQLEITDEICAQEALLLTMTLALPSSLYLGICLKVNSLEKLSYPSY